MAFSKLTNILTILTFTALLSACGSGGDDWQTGTPGSGGTGGQNPINTSPELTPLRFLTSMMSDSGFYQINSAANYTKIISPTVDSLDNYHWVQSSYQLDNATPRVWQDVTTSNQMLLPTGEWSLVNDKKLILHFQDNYAETMSNQPLMGKYSVIGSPINLAVQGYPSGATAFNMQYTPYQDEFVVNSFSYPASYLPTTSTIEDIFNNYQTQWLIYGETLGGEESVVYQLRGNSNDQQGSVEFFSLAHVPNPPSNQALYPISTGSWKRVMINGNDILIITPPDDVKKILITTDRMNRILVKQANSNENVKIGKFYPANQPVNMTWYNQQAMDYILQQGLSSVIYK